MADQPEALRLADALDARVVPRWVHGTGQTPKQSGYKKDAKCEQAAACLRRQHAEIESLKAERDALRVVQPSAFDPVAAMRLADDYAFAQSQLDGKRSTSRKYYVEGRDEARAALAAYLGIKEAK